jgi:hypothetical protein
MNLIDTSGQDKVRFHDNMIVDLDGVILAISIDQLEGGIIAQLLSSF